ncbi:protein kinase domain-containing protein [Citrus sinensis]|nr:protein kinase domain-containing protein [Citrus sinensis]
MITIICFSCQLNYSSHAQVEKNEKEKIPGTDSPRGVLEIPVTGTDSDSSSGSCGSSSSPEKSTPQRAVNRESGGWKSMIDSIKKKSVVRRFSVIPLLTNYELTKKNLWKKLGRLQIPEDDDADDGGSVPIVRHSWKNFDFAELAAATDNFNSENLIGKGGHAEVYKGCLPDGEVVAVKKIIKNAKEDEERISDFLSELGIVAHINHPNAAKLIGFSTENGFHLVLQFLPHGSLSSLLFGSTECLEWTIRYKIALGIAEGLQYLHHDCHRRIIHRDIKASNILLSEDYEAQISDFGLAKWLPDNWSHHIVFPIEGTFGYLSPEYFMHGIVDEKTDVFAFGVLLLELITGRRAVDSRRQSLVIWAKPLLQTSNFKELVDPRLADAYDLAEMKRAMLTASVCIHHLSTMRPQMTRVLQLLRGEGGQTDLKPKPSARRTVILDGSDEEYSSTCYLKDLNRHMQLALE